MADLFQGLRQFKQKFDPECRPKYLVCPGGLLVPRVLANVASLVSGGLRGVVAKGWASMEMDNDIAPGHPGIQPWCTASKKSGEGRYRIEK
jgi:hypothetical protein